MLAKAWMLFAVSGAYGLLQSPVNFRAQMNSIDSHIDAFPELVNQKGSKLFESGVERLRDEAEAFLELAGLGESSLPKIKKVDEWDYITRFDAEEILAAAETDKTDEYKLSDYQLRVRSDSVMGLGIDTVKQHAGYLDVADDKHFFYWFFESRNDPKTDPVILWLNGGPGCSSLTGLFMELGPSMIDNTTGLPVYNDFAWNSNASVIFLDQPLNVGYSYGSRTAGTYAASKDVSSLLRLFFKTFPEYSNLDFHIAGESYAGHYIPVFSHDILQDYPTEINLKSILIGNGWTDPLTQFAYYPEMACNSTYPPVLDDETCDEMTSKYGRCKALIDQCYQNEITALCVIASFYCENLMLGAYQKTGQNVYDVREKCEDNDLCYSVLDKITFYLNQAEVKDALGVEIKEYEGCSNQVYQDFIMGGDMMKPIHTLVPDILEQIPVLIYAGDADYICNWYGNRAWTEALEWPGQAEFAPLPLTDVYIGKSQYGQVKQAGNFAFLRILGAGHMVPYNQPESALYMVNSWVHGNYTL